MTSFRKTDAVSMLVGVVLSMILGLVYLLTDSTAALLGVLGIYASIIISLLFATLDRFRSLTQINEMMGDLMADEQIKTFCRRSISDLKSALGHGDPVFRELLGTELNDMNLRLDRIASGVVRFRAESWRQAWRKLIESEDVKFYRSVALVKCDRYWQDNAGRGSIEFNKRIAGLMPVKRIFIVWDSQWSSPGVRRLIEDQRAAGIEVRVVRKSEVPGEEDLLHDFGIYGDRAVGYQHLDDECNTISFDLHFDRETCDKTADRFRRLELYATDESTAAYLADEGLRKVG